jgi:hypothetical protein
MQRVQQQKHVNPEAETHPHRIRRLAQLRVSGPGGEDALAALVLRRRILFRTARVKELVLRVKRLNAGRRPAQDIVEQR